MIDSERVTFEGYQYELAKMGLTIDKAFYITLLGKPVKASTSVFMMSMVMIFQLSRSSNAYMPIWKNVLRQRVSHSNRD